MPSGDHGPSLWSDHPAPLQAFIELDSEESAAKAAAEEHEIEGGTKLLCELKTDYFERKKKEHAEKKAGGGDGAAAAESSAAAASASAGEKKPK